jgi:adenosylmethionine---8-amino-7-oxononanoate aminotransferase
MNRFLILGADTDAGKTTFALLWLAAFPGRYHYWKPVETGEPDSGQVRRLVPETAVHDPIAQFQAPLAPPLAARLAGQSIPSAADLAARLPNSPQLLVETFGGPFSPLNEEELQIELIARLRLPAALVVSSKLGAIGRALSILRAVRPFHIEVAAVVLVGPPDDYAREQIAKHGRIAAASLVPPERWDQQGVRAAALAQLETLEALAHRRPAQPEVDSALVERDGRYVWRPYTPLRGADAPLPVVGADAEFLHLADGRRLIDAISSWWTILHGHREPRLMAAMHEASQAFDHVLFAGVTHAPAVRVAELLLETAPWRGGRVFFSDNGSTAVEVALKMAYQFWRHHGEPDRTLFIGFDNGYHGDTFGAMAVGRDPLFFGNFEPLLFRAARIAVSAERLDEALQQHAGRVAAVILEPLVQGAGGMRMHSPAELRAIFELTKRHGVLFIADEVMTGCFRTGTMWAHQSAGIAPDLICAAKTLAGGILPLAATLASPEVVAAFDSADRERTFFHGHSFTAHPLACAIAAANLEWLASEPPEAPAKIEAFWKESLGCLRNRPSVRDVRIQGSIAAVELAAPGGYLAATSAALRRSCLERGVFLRPLGNVIYALPPLRIGLESLQQIADAMIAAVDECLLPPFRRGGGGG